MSRENSKLKTVGVCGHFDGNKPTSSGQIIKTRTVTDELIRQLGKNQVMIVDSSGGGREIPRMLQQSWYLFKNCRNIIFFPAYKGLCVFAPVYSFYNKFFHRGVHYVVIGGWLNKFINQHKWLAGILKRFTGIYVETAIMKKALEKRKFKNVFVMSNFKDLSILKPEELSNAVEEPYKLCTFSRVMKEKGIEEAINAVKSINRKYGRIVYVLDIYGQIDDGYKKKFKAIEQNFPSYISYGGLIPYGKSVEIVKKYFALLFPTYYYGEGFAGTLIDAMAAGTPVIASDWKYNREIIKSGKTGVLLKNCNAKNIEKKLEQIAENPEYWNKMQISALKEAHKYEPEAAIKPLMDRLK